VGAPPRESPREHVSRTTPFPLLLQIDQTLHGPAVGIGDYFGQR
jgi:hypothetical protein